MRFFCTLLSLLLLAAPGAAQTTNPDEGVERGDGAGHPLPLDAAIPLPNRSVATLYDNGPLVNSIGTGVGGADESVVQETMTFIYYGWGSRTDSGWRLADDFTIPDGERWTMAKLTLYLYQTGSTTVPTINSLAVQILDGPPDDPGSTVLYGDLTTNCLTGSSWTGIYRVKEFNSGVSAARPIMASTCALGTTLGPGTYWIEWTSMGVPNLAGPWTPAVTIARVPETGNARFTEDDGITWRPAVDGIFDSPQGFPFLIDGIRLPVELTAFDALTDGADVHLTWATATETNNAGFHIEMKRDVAEVDSEWHTLTFVGGAGTTRLPQAYRYRVSDLKPGRYAFRLKQVDFDGTFAYSPVVEALIALPDATVYFEAYPNPLAAGTDQTTLAFAVPSAQVVQIVVYDMLGRAIRTVYSGRPEPEIQHLVRLQGAGLPGGRYAVRLHGETVSAGVLITRTP